MLTPETEAELAACVEAASAPLKIVGGGTRPIGRTGATEVLRTTGLSGITFYDPGALTLVAQAGTPLSEIETALKKENQRLAFEPMDNRTLLGASGTPTIGGVVAANVSGPRRIQSGACRDSLIGVRFVDGCGNILKSGGRVMKNVTGYDLVKLMAGSWGTLGILTEASFKLLPGVGSTATLRILGLSDGDALRALTSALSSPFEVSGAAHAQKAQSGDPETLIRIEGFADSISYRTEKLRERLSEFGEIAVETEPSKNADIWAWVRDVKGFATEDGDIWRVSVKPSDGPDIVRRAGASALYDWGCGLIWLLVEPGTDLRAQLGAFSGHATLVRASEETKTRMPVFQPEPEPVRRLSEGLREKFDPRGILNPGMMG